MDFEQAGQALYEHASLLEDAVSTDAPQPHDGSQDQWLTAWTQALTEMELDVTRVEQILQAAHRGAEMPDAAMLMDRRWEPPRGLGPMPHPLLRRAQQLLLRQQQLAEQVSEAAATTRRHLQVTEALQEREPTPALYLDVAL